MITLADKLRMPAMLVAKFVIADQIKEEKFKEKFNQQHSNNEDSFNSSTLNDTSIGSTASNLQNDSDIELKHDLSANDSTAKELDTSFSIDEQLSQQLNWLTCKLRSMYRPESNLNQSDNSLNNSNSFCIPTSNKSLNLTPHQLATSTWLMRNDPQLAYEVYKSSIVDGYYGSCVEFIKRYHLLSYFDSR